MTALPMTGFHRARIAPRGKQCFRNTATLGSLPPGPARIARCPDSLPVKPMGCLLSVSGTLTRFPCSANKNACPIARVAHLPQKPCYSVYYMRACFTHTKRPLLPCYLAGKRSLVFSVYSVWLHAKNTKLYGWLVASFMPIIYIFVTISHACVHFLSRIYTPIIPQTVVIVKPANKKSRKNFKKAGNFT